MRRFLPGAMLLSLLCVATGCTPGGDDAAESVLLITLDTTRRDALGCYAGSGVASTPHLDRLAAEGVVYDRAYTAVPVTLPSHASMLTGLYPPRHTVRDNGVSPLPQTAETVAEIAQRAGHQTAAFLAAVVLSETFGLNQGFDVYETPAPRASDTGSHFTERPAREVVNAVLDWWKARDRARPFFVWAHFFDPHAPYEVGPGLPPGASKRDVYQSEVTAMDREIGRLLDHLRADGAFATTTIVVVADHGEAFGEHGTFSHEAYCYGENVNIPFFVRYPDGRYAGERRDQVVSVVDVCPTLLEAMGLSVPPGLDGLALGSVDIPADRGVYVESYAGFLSYGWSPLAGWIDAEGKFLHSSAPEFFDLRTDPGEAANTVSSVDTGPYVRAIEEMLARGALPRDDEGGIDAQLLEQIRSLGYASAGADTSALPHPLAPSSRPGPGVMKEVHSLLQDALTEFNAERFDSAERLFTLALAQNRDNLFALDFAATCRMRQGRFAEAIDPLQRLLAAERRHVKHYFNLGVCLLQIGRTAEAIEAFEEAHALTPDDPRIASYLDRLRRDDADR